MAPFARGIVRPRSGKMRQLLSLGLASDVPDPRRRPRRSLIDPLPSKAPMHKGNPILERQFDTLNATITGFRKYQPPFVRPPPVNRDVTPETFHEMKGKFRFEATGKFTNNGEKMRDCMLRVSRDLRIVGWVKCRSKFSIGHLQGDVYSLSYFRRWLEVHAREKINSVRFFDENFGIQAFDYERVASVDDYRSPAQKKLHSLERFEKNKSLLLQKESAQRAREYQQLYDEMCIRNY